MSIEGLILVSLSLGLAAWLFFLWTVKSGQYDDPEGPKYRMLDDDEPPPGGRGPRDAGEGASPPRGTRAERSESEQGPAEQGRGPDGSAGGAGRPAP